MADAISSRTCPKCATTAPAEAAFCSACGHPLDAASAPAPSARIKWYYNIWFMLFMLFFVAGPFGLPLVWKHPRWGRGVKWTLTLVMVVYTWLLIQSTLLMVRTLTAHFEQLQSTLGF